MDMTTKTMEALRRTSKGRLKYDTNWHCSDNIQSMLEECTSPPGFYERTINKIRTVAKRKSDSVFNKSNNADSNSFTDMSEKLDISPTNVNSKSAVMNYSSNSLKIKKEIVPTVRQEIISLEANRTELAIKQYDEQLRKTAEMNLKLRREKMEQETKMLQQWASTRLMEIEQQQELDAMRTLEIIEAEQEANAMELQQKQNKIKESHKKHARMVNEKMQQAEQQKRQLEAEAKRKEEDTKCHMETIQRNIQDMKQFRNQITDRYAKCTSKEHLAANIPKFYESVNQIVAKVETLFSHAEAIKDTENLSKAISDLCLRGKNIVDFVNNAIAEADKKAEDEKKRKAAEEEATKQSQATAAAKQSQQLAAATSAAATAAEGEMLCVALDAFEEYERLLKLLQNVTDQVTQAFTADEQLKKSKMSLQIAVNTPVNAIGSQSGAHLRDKLERIHGLLTGQQVEVSGKHVSARHPAAVMFCKELLARKLVSQSEIQISSNPADAFVFAAIAVGVWCELSDFGDLLLANFYTRCPYLVPYYRPKEEGQSSEDFFKSLGYLYIDGQCEKQDKFLKRMSGFTRLYAAVLISVPPRGPQHPHPHGLENGWTWLTRLLNIDPRPDITATILYDFLQVCGCELLHTYGKQFQKVLHVICTDYIPKIWKVTPKGSGGPVKRLEIFLQDCLKKGHIPKPEGKLPNNFWFS